MATYKKQLKDQNGDNIIPALGTATVTSTNIDWSTIGLTGDAAFGWNDCGNTGYVDNRNDGWSGMNFTNATSSKYFGEVSVKSGSWSHDAEGGGATLTSNATAGVYLITVSICESNNVGDGYCPIRIRKNSTNLIEEAGVPNRGGGNAVTFIAALNQGDNINLQIYTSNTGRNYSYRTWGKAWLLRTI